MRATAVLLDYAMYVRLNDVLYQQNTVVQGVWHSFAVKLYTMIAWSNICRSLLTKCVKLSL